MTSFEHNATYKISSVFDGCVLDVKGEKRKKETPILTWDWGQGRHQMWKANGESDGFRLATLLPPTDKEDYLAVLDESLRSSAVTLWSFNGKKNQQWMAKEVPNGGGAVFIINMHTGKGLRNMGHGNPVKCTQATADDRGTWWNITQL